MTDQGQLRLRGGHWTPGALWKLGGPLCLSVCPLLPLLLPHSSPRDGHQSASPVEAWRLGEGLTSPHKSHVHRHNLREPCVNSHAVPAVFSSASVTQHSGLEIHPGCSGTSSSLLLLLSAVHGVDVTQLVYHSPLRDMGFFSSLGLLKTLGTEFYRNADVLFSR